MMFKCFIKIKVFKMFKCFMKIKSECDKNVIFKVCGSERPRL